MLIDIGTAIVIVTVIVIEREIEIGTETETEIRDIIENMIGDHIVKNDILGKRKFQL